MPQPLLQQHLRQKLLERPRLEVSLGISVQCVINRGEEGQAYASSSPKMLIRTCEV